MWTPRSWDDITAMIGVAEEAGGLDFKRTVGGNAEVAKDIAAMTVNGGVLVYGIDEDPATGLASQIVKQPLKGAKRSASGRSPRPGSSRRRNSRSSSCARIRPTPTVSSS